MPGRSRWSSLDLKERGQSVSSHTHTPYKRHLLEKTVRLFFIILLFVSITFAVVALALSSNHVQLRPVEILANHLSSWNYHRQRPLVSDFDYADHNHTPVEASKQEVLSCGSSRREAFDAGCIYDSLLPAWVPAPCFNATFYREHMKPLEWNMYIGPDAIEPIDHVPANMGTYMDMWTSHAYRVRHCAYSRDKLARALRPGGGWIEEWLLMDEHMEHCAGVEAASAVERGVGEDDATSLHIVATFQTCRRINPNGDVVVESFS